MIYFISRCAIRLYKGFECEVIIEHKGDPLEKLAIIEKLTIMVHQDFFADHLRRAVL
jgi:hypothetical protein